MENKSFNKIFQIGFNKCGTLSIHNFFLDNGLKSIHWDESKLAETIDKNFKSNKKILLEYEEYDCFTDMENLDPSMDKVSIYSHVRYFKQFDIQYPNSIFILNQRNIDDWILSRKNHDEGKYLETYKNIFDLSSDEEVFEQWKRDWYNHENNVKKYFKNRPKDLLIFDIDKEQSKFIDFMKNRTIIRSAFFPHLHKTMKEEKVSITREWKANRVPSNPVNFSDDKA
jgi:hypothetical protein